MRHQALIFYQIIEKKSDFTITNLDLSRWYLVQMLKRTKKKTQILFFFFIILHNFFSIFHWNIYIRLEKNIHFCLQTLTKHFKTIPVAEKEALSYFIYTVKTNSNKLDQKNGLNNDAT